MVGRATGKIHWRNIQISWKKEQTHKILPFKLCFSDLERVVVSFNEISSRRCYIPRLPNIMIMEIQIVNVNIVFSPLPCLSQQTIMLHGLSSLVFYS